MSLLDIGDKIASITSAVVSIIALALAIESRRAEQRRIGKPRQMIWSREWLFAYGGLGIIAMSMFALGGCAILTALFVVDRWRPVLMSPAVTLVSVGSAFILVSTRTVSAVRGRRRLKLIGLIGGAVSWASIIYLWNHGWL